MKYSKEEIYYVYVYLDPRNDYQPFYVGKGKDNRYLNHLNETKENTLNIRKFYKIQKMRREDFDPAIVFHTTYVDEETAYQIEEGLIELYGRKDIDKDGILTNICKDNRPPNATGRVMSDKTKKKIGLKSKGRIHSDKTKLKCGIKPENYKVWNKGSAETYTFDETAKENMSNAYWKKFKQVGYGNRKGCNNTKESNLRRSTWNKENNWEPPKHTQIKKGKVWTKEQIERREATKKKNRELKKLVETKS